MAFVAGKFAYFQLDNAAGTLVNLSTYVNDISLPIDVDMLESTTFSATDKTYIPGLGDGKISISGLWDSVVETQLVALQALTRTANTTTTFNYGPDTNTSGRTKYTGECFITSFEVSQKVDGISEFKAEFQVTGGITRTTF